ncbi:MAG TPA: hypothetical protein VK049_06715 [Paenalcaligenes sp.]|nr:hypothetical protein [Paenalcaligenes sp.]
MTSKSRRAFLKGRVPKASNWTRFYERLTQEFPEQVQRLGTIEQGPGHALFAPTHPSQVHAVFLLAQHFEVQLGLMPADLNTLQEHPEPLLWLNPMHLNRCEPVDSEGRFYIEPGATMQSLVAAGLAQFSALPKNMMFIRWLADSAFHQYQRLENTGVQMASMVLADCSVARLGPFGAQSSMALNSPSLQRLIPQLFQLLNTQIGQRCQELPVWPAQYRLDALADQGKVNLAYLVLGQGLELGWVEWVVLDRFSCVQPAFKQLPTLTDEQKIWAQELDAAVQHRFDPKGRFLPLL